MRTTTSRPQQREGGGSPIVIIFAGAYRQTKEKPLFEVHSNLLPYTLPSTLTNVEVLEAIAR